MRRPAPDRTPMTARPLPATLWLRVPYAPAPIELTRTGEAEVWAGVTSGRTPLPPVPDGYRALWFTECE
jgi:hypothetical protein